MSVPSDLRLLRIGFLPLLLASNGSMLVAVQRLTERGNTDTPHALSVIAANVGWMLYGSVLNDVCDRRADAFNPAAEKVLAQRELSRSYIVGLLAGAMSLPIALDAYTLVTFPNPAGVSLFVATTIIGALLATAYSAPPVRARARPFGATWSLMFFFPFCFLRVLALGLDQVNGLTLSAFVLVTVFLWACHGITTAALKDVPDAFADRRDGIRSVPNVWGAAGSIAVTLLCMVLTATVALAGIGLGFVDALFLLVLFPAFGVYGLLTLYLANWYRAASQSADLAERPPRKLFHTVGYIGTWGILIPAFMFSLHLP